MRLPQEPEDLWEVYSGEAGLAQVMSEFGWKVRTFDKLNGWNFEGPRHRRKFHELLDEDLVWWAPPCRVWSPLQNLNALTEEQKIALDAERDYEEHVHLKFVLKGFKKQYHEGRHGAIENPAYSNAWKTRAFGKLPGAASYLDMCAYGAGLPDEYGVWTPIKKPTQHQLACQELADQQCCVCDGTHSHLPIEGSSPGITL